MPCLLEPILFIDSETARGHAPPSRSATLERFGKSGATLDVSSVLDGMQIVVQPIVDLATGETYAVEALARFGHMPGIAVPEVFRLAHLAGYGHALEAACVSAALRIRADLPSGVRLSVNLSPDSLCHPEVSKIWPADLDGVIVEVTEYSATDRAELSDRLNWLRARGAAIAVDDVSTGYAGLLRLAGMRPELVKIDRSVITGVHENEAQTAVLDALVRFSHRIGAAVIGEGVESPADLSALADFDVDYGQGYAIGEPAAQASAISGTVVEQCQRMRRHLLRRGSALGVTSAGIHGMHLVTSALSKATDLADLHAAVARAARELKVDEIGVSVLDGAGSLREISSSGAAIDLTRYRLEDYPATETVLRTGDPVEIHRNDPTADPAERIVLARANRASLLIIPFVVGGERVGILELAHRTHRRWTSHDVAHGHALAAHVGQALSRISC